MTTDPYKGLTVFISSAMRELADERTVLSAQLEEMGLHGFLYDKEIGATTTTHQEQWRELIKSSDLYIGIFYKKLGDATLDEYRAAKEMAPPLPMLLYFRGDETSDFRSPELSRFIEELGGADEQGWSYFADPSDLRRRLFADIKREQAAAWRRSRTAVVSEAGLRGTDTDQGPALERTKLRHEPTRLTPRPIRRFRGTWVGRDRDLAGLRRRVGSDEHPLVALVRTAGIGKRSLLQHLRDMEDDFPDGAAIHPSGAEGDDFDDLLRSVFDRFYDAGSESDNQAYTTDSLEPYLAELATLVVFPDVPDGHHLAELSEVMEEATVCYSTTHGTDPDAFNIEVDGLDRPEDMLGLFAAKYGGEVPPEANPYLLAVFKENHGHPGHIAELANRAANEAWPAEEDGAVHPLIAWAFAVGAEPLRTQLISALTPDVETLAALTAAVGQPVPREVILKLVPQDLLDEAMDQGVLQPGSPRYRLATTYAPLFTQVEAEAGLMGMILDSSVEWAEAAPRYEIAADRLFLLRMIDWGLSHGRDADVIRLARASAGALMVAAMWDAWRRVAEAAQAAAARSGDTAAEAWALHELGCRAALLGDDDTAIGLLTTVIAARRDLRDDTGARLAAANLELLRPRLRIPWMPVVALVIGILILLFGGPSSLPGPSDVTIPFGGVSLDGRRHFEEHQPRLIENRTGEAFDIDVTITGDLAAGFCIAGLGDECALAAGTTTETETEGLGLGTPLAAASLAVPGRAVAPVAIAAFQAQGGPARPIDCRVDRVDRFRGTLRIPAEGCFLKYSFSPSDRGNFLGTVRLEHGDAAWSAFLTGHVLEDPDVVDDPVVVEKVAEPRVIWPPNVYQEVDYAVTVSNTGEENVTIVGIVDFVVSDDYVPGPAPAGSCLPDDGSGRPIAPGGALTCTYSLMLRGAAGERIKNYASVTVQEGEVRRTITTSAEVVVAPFSVTKDGEADALDDGPPLGRFTVTVANLSDRELSLDGLVDSAAGDLLAEPFDCPADRAIAAGGRYTCRFTLELATDEECHRNDVEATVTDHAGQVFRYGDTAKVCFEVLSAGVGLDYTVDVDGDGDFAAAGTRPEGSSDDVAFRVELQNIGPDPLTVTEITETPFGEPLGTCRAGMVVPPEVDGVAGTVDCGFVRTVPPLDANAGSFVSELSVTLAGGEGIEDFPPEGQVTVTFANEPPEITVELKGPDEATSGEEIDVAITVGNESVATDPVTITAMTGPDDADLAAACALPMTIAPVGTLACTFATPVVGEPGTELEVEVRAVAVDDEGTEVVQIGQLTVPITGPSPTPDITIEKRVVPWAVPRTIGEGDRLDYELVVRNRSQATLVGVRVTDTLLGLSGTCGVDTLGPEESTFCERAYVVQQADIDAGGVTNVASVTATTPDGGAVSDDDQVTTSILSVELETSTAGSGLPQAGDTVTLQYEAGPTPSSADSVGVTDVLATTNPSCPPPGQGITVCQAQYTVTSADADRGYFESRATATAVLDTTGGIQVASATDVLRVDVAGSAGITLAVDTDPASQAPFGFSGAITATLRDGEETGRAVEPGEHRVSIVGVPAGWVRIATDCTDDNSGQDGGDIVYRVDLGEEVTCTVRFAQSGPIGPILDIEDEILNFGQVTIGTTAVGTVHVRNAGTAPLRVLAVSPAPPVVDPTVLWVSDNRCDGLLLDPGKSCTFDLTYKPDAPWPPVAAWFVITADSAAATSPPADRSVLVVGTGT